MFRDFLTETEKQQAGIRKDDDGLVAQYKWQAHQTLRNYGKDAFTSPQRPKAVRTAAKRPPDPAPPAQPMTWSGALFSIGFIAAFFYGVYALIVWGTGSPSPRRPSVSHLETQAELNQRCQAEGRKQQYRGAQPARDAQAACLARGPVRWTFYY